MRARSAAWLSRSAALARSLRGSVDGRSLRLIVPAVVALVLWPFLLPIVPLEIKEPLFGDTIVYEYTGWCLRHGLKLYRDFGMMEGPFTHFLMAGMQAVSGITDREFRKCDLVLLTGVSAVIGALLAPTADLKRPGRIVSRLSWAALTSTLWMAWYSTLTWEMTTQREVYYSLFGSIGMVLLFTSRNYSRRGAMMAIFIGALLVTSQVFGKPTGVMYPATGSLCVLLQDSKGNTTLSLRCRTFAAGVAVCVLTAILAIALWGSFPGYWLWCVKIPYVENRFLLRGDWFQLLLVGFDGVRQIAIVSFVAGVAAIACGLLPGRALGFALLPLIAFLGFCLQGRGLDYQAIPVEVGGMVLALVLMSALWPKHGSRAWLTWRGLAAMLFMTGFAYHAFQNIQGSTFRWTGDPTHWKAPCSHHYGDAEREVGLYIKAHTRPTDAGFVCCGNSHLILLYAERPTASPFFHSAWLNSIELLPQSTLQPNAVQLAALTDLQTEVRDMACTAVERKRPAFMVFNTGAPAAVFPNIDQVYGMCPGLREMVASEYAKPTTMGEFQIYMRKHRH